jgi:hypothetical protein
MKPKLDLSRLRDLHRRSGINQEGFWAPLGVTQSAASRYENGPAQATARRGGLKGRPLPRPVDLLRQLRHSGRITDQDLARAAKALGWTQPNPGSRSVSRKR